VLPRAVCCSVLQCLTVRCVCCSVLQCVEVCCSVLLVGFETGLLKLQLCYLVRCVAVCYSVLQCVTVCCSVLQCVTVCCVCCSVLQCVEVCCSVLLGGFKSGLLKLRLCRLVRRVTVRYSVLQCVACFAGCCIVLQCHKEVLKNGLLKLRLCANPLFNLSRHSTGRAAVMACTQHYCSLLLHSNRTVTTTLPPLLCCSIEV